MTSFSISFSRNSAGFILLSVVLFCIPALGFAATNTTPPASASTQFAKEGIFGCSRNAAALSNSVGAFFATGGVYVPVADYTVELNTGTLVYQQCVLRGLVNRMSDSAASALINKQLRIVNTGNNGNPLYVVNPQQERLIYASDPVVLRDLQNGTLDAADPSIAPAIKQAYARYYQNQTRNRQNSLNCPMIKTTAKEFIQSGGRNVDSGLFWPNFINLSYSACHPLGALEEAQVLIGGDVAQSISDLNAEVDRGGGYYAVTHVDENGNRIIDTPSSVVEKTTQLAIDSGYMKTLNASDVDQMVGALFAGLSTQILSGPGGLNGITNAIGSQPSYLTQLTAESSAGLRNAASNAAIQVLNGAIAVEKAYNQVMNAIAQKLSTTIAQLRGAENQCWEKIIVKTCKTPLAADKTCTSADVCTAPTTTFGQPQGQPQCTAGAILRVATSTAFSQPVITSQIAPLATQAVQNIQSSQQGLVLLNGLAVAVANTTSLDAQRLALIQLDQLVAQGKLHQQAAVTSAQQQQAAINESMATLVTNTVQAWADSTDTNTGWCNVNRQEVVDFWVQRWKQ